MLRVEMRINVKGGHTGSYWVTWPIYIRLTNWMGFPDGSAVKNLPASAGDAGLIPGSGRSPGVGNGYPLQYSCLENSMNRGAWQATVHGVAKELDLT